MSAWRTWRRRRLTMLLVLFALLFGTDQGPGTDPDG
jgi:hypothetical protein